MRIKYLNKTTLLFIILLLFYAKCIYGQQTEKGHLRIAFYNAENAFDCKHDSLHDDSAFLPESPRNWSLYRYHQKLHHLSQAIASLTDVNGLPPALVGMAEVENDSVLRDLTQRSSLRAAGYRYVMTHNTPDSDPRGIDVALLYRPSHFHPISCYEHHVAPQTKKDGATMSLRARNLLLVSGELLTGDTLDVIVCHWPSKLGGRRLSRQRREMAATATVALVDSLYGIRAQPHIVVMGDMNDTPLSTATTSLCKHAFTNLTQNCQGSYRYKGRWEQLDQLFVSSNLTKDTSTIHVVNADVLREAFLLESEPVYGGQRPFRTWNGFRYKGGYSDHLPVYLDMEWTVMP